MIAVSGVAATTFFGDVSKPTAARPVADMQFHPGVPRDRNPAISAEEMARSFAGIGQGMLAQLNRAMQEYNRLTSEEYQQYCNSPEYKQRMEEHLAGVRALHGEDAVKVSRQLWEPEKWIEMQRQTIDVMVTGLQGHFNISGSLCSYDAATDTYSPGEFTLCANSGYFAVVIDSSAGLQVSTEGKPFTSDFLRNYAPNAAFLPYNVTDQALFDIIA